MIFKRNRVTVLVILLLSTLACGGNEQTSTNQGNIVFNPATPQLDAAQQCGTTVTLFNLSGSEIILQALEISLHGESSGIDQKMTFTTAEVSQLFSTLTIPNGTLASGAVTIDASAFPNDNDITLTVVFIGTAASGTPQIFIDTLSCRR